MIPDALRTALDGRYHIARELGAGGMATVYLARDLRHERQVALKVLRPELAAVLGAERFLAEIRTTANLQHPHILGLIDSGQVDATVFYVMPYVAGESLRDRLVREKQLPVDDALRITTEVAHALDYAHRQGVIHRDIKPENILLQDGQAMVADFGIALAATQAVGGRMTETGMSLGTPQYMSPEQALGERDLTPRSDQYALGCVLYEMLAGEPPFTGPTVQAIVARVMTAAPDSVTTRRQATPPGVAVAIERALQKVPADRFKSCVDFAEALRVPSVTAERAVAVGGSGPRSRAMQWAPWGVAAVATLGWGASTMGPSEPTAAEPDSYVEFVIEAPPGGQVDPNREFAISPDGRRVALLASDASGVSRLYVRDLDTRELRALPGTDGATTAPFFSPDGERVAVNRGGQLFTIDLATGRHSLVTRVNPAGSKVTVWSGSWGVDDTLIVSVVADSGVKMMKVAATGGQPAWLFADLAQQRFVGSHVSATQVVFSEQVRADTGQLKIGLVSLTTGERRLLEESGYEPRYTGNGELVFGTADGDVVARAFDPGTATFTGPRRTLATGVRSVVRSLPAFWSSVNGTVVFQESGTRTNTLVEVDLAGVEREVSGGIGLTGPRYSPDGRRVAVVKGGRYGGEVWVHSLGDSGQMQVTPPLLRARFPSWSPDGQSLFFTASFGTEEDIGTVSADGSAPPRLLLTLPHPQRQPIATPDGKRLIFIDVRPDVGLFESAIDGSGSLREVVSGKATTERHPVVSGDGHWLAYSSFGNDGEEVYLTSYPTAGARTVISAGGGMEPVFHPDGRRLFYRSGSKLIEATLQLTPDVRVLSRRTLFDRPLYEPWNPGRNYDIHPDGTRFLFVKGTASSNNLVVRVPTLAPRTP